MEDKRLVIIINGSPNINGNTAKILKEIAKRLKGYNLNIHIIHLIKSNIAFCRGCGECKISGKCILSDDFGDIISLIKQSSAIVIGSPIYNGGMSAMLKCLWERLSTPRLFFGLFDGKYSIGVATSQASNPKKLAHSLGNGIVRGYMGSGECVGYVGLRLNGRGLAKKEIRHIDKICRRLYTAINTGKISLKSRIKARLLSVGYTIYKKLSR